MLEEMKAKEEIPEVYVQEKHERILSSIDGLDSLVDRIGYLRDRIQGAAVPTCGTGEAKSLSLQETLTECPDMINSLCSRAHEILDEIENGLF